MKVTAKARGLKISARKLRNSADLIRNARVVEAEHLLAATPKKGAVMVADALKSAVANAENNHNLRKSGLRIAEIRVDEGSARKTWRPRSRGMAHPILHRSFLRIQLRSFEYLDSRRRNTESDVGHEQQQPGV